MILLITDAQSVPVDILNSLKMCFDPINSINFRIDSHPQIYAVHRSWCSSATEDMHDPETISFSYRDQL